MLVKTCVGITTKSTPYRSETNRIAENAVRRGKESASAPLVQSGLTKKSGGEKAMECFCSVRNIQEQLTDRKSPCETRFGTPFDGPTTPFGT